MSRLNTIIDANIKENGNQEITGKALNYVLNEIAKEVEQGGNVKADGVYPDLIAGDLAGRGESVPAEFTFRASGGKSIKDGKAYIKRIKGNSVVWNNMVDSRGYDGGFFVDVPPPIIQGHKYLLKRTHATNSLFLIPIINGEEKYEMNLPNGVYAAIFESPHTGDITRVYSERYSGACVISDLTKMYGAGNEPTTIEEYEARKPIVADEYAYNEGEVIHMNTEGIKSVGDNAWDEEWELGRLNTDTGQPNPGNNGIHSKNYNKVLPNEAYYCGYNVTPIFAMFYDAEYNLIQQVSGSNHFINIRNRQFTTPANAVYMKFYVVDITTYNHDIMITLVHSGWKQDTDAGYQPYWQDTLPLPIIRKYFPQGMKSAGNAHDEIRFNKASGKWEAVRRIGSVDLGSLEWQIGNYNGYSAFYSHSNALNGLWADGIFYLCAKYQPAEHRIYTEGLDKSIAFNNGYYGNPAIKDEIVIRDSSYPDVATFKAAMQGVILYYELAEPIVTEITDSFRDYYNVADFGTEQAISNIPSAPFSADIIYQFNAVDMIRENYNEIERIKAALAKVGITLD